MNRVLKTKGLCAVAPLAAAMAVCIFGVPAWAEPPPPVIGMLAETAPPPSEQSLPKGTPVSIRFAPPVGVPIRYRSTERKTSNGQLTTRTVDLVVHFERSGNSWVLEGRIDMPGLAPHLLANPSVKLALRPIRFLLDQDGAFVGIENEEAYWAGVEPIIERIVDDASLPTGGADVIRGMFRKMRDLPSEERAELVGRKFVQITTHAGIDLAVGETAETPQWAANVPLPIADPTIRRTFAVTLTSATASSARFETKTSFDRDDVARVMGQIIDLAPAGKRLEEIPDLHQSFVHIVSRNTGLTLHSVETSRAVDDDPDGASEKVITLERID